MGCIERGYAVVGMCKERVWSYGMHRKRVCSCGYV